MAFLTIRWIVSGRVQGVGFRWFAVRAAEEASVTGWVANRADGRVEIVAQGSEGQLAEFERLVAKGPRFGNVEDVERVDISHDMETFNSFDIKYL